MPKPTAGCGQTGCAVPRVRKALAHPARSSFPVRLFTCILATALLGLLARAGAAAPIPVRDLVQGYSTAYQYAISPDGGHVLRHRPGASHQELYRVNDDGGVGRPVDLAHHRMWLPAWSRDGSRLYGVGHRGQTAFVLEVDPTRPEAQARQILLAGVSGRVVHVSPHPADRDRLLLRTYGRSGEQVHHCALDGSGCADVSRDLEGGSGWRAILDEAGRPAVRFRFEETAFAFQSRLDRGWRAAGAVPVDRSLLPLTAVDSTGWATALSNVTTDTVSLVRWNARTMEERVLVSTAPSDLQRALLGAGGEPLAVLSFPGEPLTTTHHPAAERALELVRVHHPGPALVNVASADTALTRFVIEVFDEVRARVVYLAAPRAGTVEEFDGSEAGRRFGREFSPTRAVRIPARDGLMLPGLLTLPRVRTGSGPPPLVLMVHGGPWLFYRWTFDPFAQVLASRGLAVLKLNYRGSAGHGNRFREAAVGELAGRVQQDIEDAFDWAARDGRTDPSRLAMLGDSFGGFCVLAAMSRGRLPVRAGVVLSGVVDTEAMVEENTFSPAGRSLWAKYLGTADVGEMKRILREVSPLRRVDRIRAPLLLLAGSADHVVQSRHAATLATELHERGRVAEIVHFAREGHSIVRPGNVVAAYRRIVDFLGRHLD